MSRRPLDWDKADRYHTTGHANTIIKTTQRPEYILTQRQREAVKAFKDGEKDELDGKALANKGLIQKQMAVALLHSYGTKPKQIAMLTGLRVGQIQSHLQHGRIHLGMEEES